VVTERNGWVGLKLERIVTKASTPNQQDMSFINRYSCHLLDIGGRDRSQGEDESEELHCGSWIVNREVVKCVYRVRKNK